jgi:O6-methylguanine-DNA--protein-cysteine methyltransferase
MKIPRAPFRGSAMIFVGMGWRYGGARVRDLRCRCGIVWSDAGVVAVHLPEEREIATRGRVFRLYPDAREVRPPLFVEIAIEGITAQLRGRDGDFSRVALDMSGISPFNQRVYEFTRTIPRGETRTYKELATEMRGAPNFRWRRRSRKIPL